MKVYRMRDLLEKLRISKSLLYYWIREGRFPKGVKISPRIRIWFEEEIENWLKERQKEKNE